MLSEYILKNHAGLEIRFRNLGGTVTSIRQDGVELTRGDASAYAGALIGRFAGRIAGASYTIAGNRFKLSANDGDKSLHGGKTGFDKVLWDVTELVPHRSYRLTHFSPDGTEGHPGNLTVEVTYTLTDENEFVLAYRATTDRATHVNFTSHCYFNLSGNPESTILDHELEIPADEFTDADPETYLPSGKILPVSPALDFRLAKPIGKDLAFSRDGYNHNYVLKDPRAARLSHPASGRFVEVSTTEPGLMLYTGHYLARPYEGVALEAQHFPDSPNRPEFPTTLLLPGETYRQETVYRFGTTRASSGNSQSPRP